MLLQHLMVTHLAPSFELGITARLHSTTGAPQRKLGVQLFGRPQWGAQWDANHFGRRPSQGFRTIEQR